jgi:hypothetical protein
VWRHLEESLAEDDEGVEAAARREEEEALLRGGAGDYVKVGRVRLGLRVYPV